MNSNEITYYYKSNSLDIYDFRFEVIKYLIYEYNILNLETISITPENARMINNIIMAGYNTNCTAQNIARLLADFIKNFCYDPSSYNTN